MVNCEEHLGLVHMVARRFKHSAHGLDYEDLFQYGCIGLVKAVKAYNPDICQFSTYAVPKIQGEIARALRDYNAGVHYTREVKNLFYKIRGNEMLNCTPEEVANYFGVEIKTANAALNYQEYPASLDNVMPNQECRKDTYAEIVGDEKSEFAEGIENEIIVNEFMETLDEREQKIIRLYIQEKTQLEISKIIGVSQVSISRIIKKIYQLAEGYAAQEVAK